MEQNTQDILIANLINNLPTLRKKLNISQVDLAKMIGVSRTTILSIENKKRDLNWSMFLSIVFVFSKNENTYTLLKVFNIYTDELENYILSFGKRR